MTQIENIITGIQHLGNSSSTEAVVEVLNLLNVTNELTPRQIAKVIVARFPEQVAADLVNHLLDYEDIQEETEGVSEQVVLDCQCLFAELCKYERILILAQEG